MNMDWALIIYIAGAIVMSAFLTFDDSRRSAHESATSIIITSLIWPAYLLLLLSLGIIAVFEALLDRGEEGK